MFSCEAALPGLSETRRAIKHGSGWLGVKRFVCSTVAGDCGLSGLQKCTNTFELGSTTLQITKVLKWLKPCRTLPHRHTVLTINGHIASQYWVCEILHCRKRSDWVVFLNQTQRHVLENNISREPPWYISVCFGVRRWRKINIGVSTLWQTPSGLSLQALHDPKMLTLKLRSEKSARAYLSPSLGGYATWLWSIGHLWEKMGYSAKLSDTLTRIQAGRKCGMAYICCVILSSNFDRHDVIMVNGVAYVTSGSSWVTLLGDRRTCINCATSKLRRTLRGSRHPLFSSVAVWCRVCTENGRKRKLGVRSRVAICTGQINFPSGQWILVLYQTKDQIVVAFPPYLGLSRPS